MKSPRCVVPPMSDARTGSNPIIVFLCDFKYCWIVGPVLATFLFISCPGCAIYPFIKGVDAKPIIVHGSDKLCFTGVFVCVVFKPNSSPKLKYHLCLYSPLCKWRLWCHSLMHITTKGFHRGKEFHPMPKFVFKRSQE